MQFGKLQTQDWIFGPKEDVGSSTYYGRSSSGQSTGPYDAKWTYSPGFPYANWNVTDLKIEFDMLEKVDAISIGNVRNYLSYRSNALP